MLRLVLLGINRPPNSPPRRRGPWSNKGSTDDLGHFIAETAPDLLAAAGVAAEASRPEMSAALRKAEARIALRVRRLGWAKGIGADFSMSLEATSTLLGLSPAETACLALAVSVHANPTMRRLSFALGDELNNSRMFEAFAALLELPVAEVRQALAKGGRLRDSQILSVDPRPQPMSEKLNWSAPALPDAMLQSDFDPFVALSDRVCIAPPPSLTWSDYAHLGEMVHVLRDFVRHAVDTRQKGISILIYGDSGQGKTQLARVLAQEIGCKLFEVAVESDGEPLDGMSRLRTLRLMHSLCAGMRCLMFWDELEDLLPAPHPVFGPSLRTPQRKGLINQTLEEAPLVTLFATNSIAAIDHAYLRRFTLCIPVKGPSQENRESKLKALPVALPEPLIRRLAACEHLSPAVLARAAVVAQAMPADGNVTAARAFEVAVDRSLEAQGKARLASHDPIGEAYDPACLNATFCPEQLVAGLKRHPAARLLLTGVSGTGKSAFAIWLARQLGRPAHLRRASDILSPYHGATEAALAQAFAEASRVGAVLILDEIEGFLASRAQAGRNYEVQQINEFLLQMESFDSILIGTTNLQTAMDDAARRRWDSIVTFGYLRADQARMLLARHLSAAGLPPADEGQLLRLDALSNLAPGDYAAIARRHRFQPQETAEAWITSLAEASRAKPEGGRRPIGFGPRIEAA